MTEPLHVVRHDESWIDKPRIERAVREILEAVGEDPDRDGLVRTPTRIANMYEEIFTGLHEDPAKHLTVTFEAEHDEMVMVRDIAMISMCEHHLVPMAGRRLVEDRAARRRLRQATAGPGTADDRDRRRARARAGSARRPRHDRGRTLLHVDARREEAGLADRDVRGARLVQDQSCDARRGDVPDHASRQPALILRGYARARVRVVRRVRRPAGGDGRGERDAGLLFGRWPLSRSRRGGSARPRARCRGRRRTRHRRGIDAPRR